jgi:hypothetical protein
MSTPTPTTAAPYSKFDREITNFDVTRWPLSVVAVREKTENPHHRAILKNFLHHLTLEVSGKYKEILVPELTVEHPVYRMCSKGTTTILDGMQAVYDFYHAVAESGQCVMGSVEEDLYVSDAGVAGEALYGHILPGNALTPEDVPDLDLDAHYLVTWRIAYTFRYDSDARLLGEYVYDDTDSYTYRKLDPSEVITVEQAAEQLAPILERWPL